MALSYAFDPSAGETPQTVAERRKLADVMAGKIFGTAPKNLGEGINALGQAWIARTMREEADQAQKSGMSQGRDAFSKISGMISGAPSAAPVAVNSPPSIPSEAMSGAPVGNTAAPLSGGLMQAGPAGSPYAGAISAVESGGKYDAVGPTTASGDRALGKYQIMGANVPAWTKAHLGQEMTPEQFLQSPQAQDAVFNGQFGQYAQKYGPEGAAKAWFAGEKGMNNPNAKDALGTTVSGYADKFKRALGGTQVASLDPSAGMAMQPKPMMPPDAMALNGQPQDGNPLANPSSFAPTNQPVPMTPQGGGMSPPPPGQPNITMAQTRPASPQIGGQPMPLTPQAKPGPANTQDGPSLQMLMQAAGNPWLNEGQRTVINEMLKHKLQGEKYGFQMTPDGTLLQTHSQTGEVKPIYQSNKPTFVPNASHDQYGNPVGGFVDAAKGTIKLIGPNGQPIAPPAEGASPSGSQTDLHGEEYLKTIDPSKAATIRAIAEGREPFPSGFVMKTPYGQWLHSALNQYKPDLTAQDYGTIMKTRANYTSGPAYQEIKAINTAIGHASKLYGVSERLGGSDIAPQYINPLIQGVKNNFPDVAPGFQADKKDYDALSETLATEISKALNGGKPHVAEKEHWRSIFSSADGPDQRRAAIKSAMGILEGRTTPLEEGYRQGMRGAGEPLSVISPENQSRWDRLLLGKDPNAVDASGAKRPAPSAPAIDPAAIEAEMRRRGHIK